MLLLLTAAGGPSPTAPVATKPKPTRVFYVTAADGHTRVAFPITVRVSVVHYLANDAQRRVAYIVVPRRWSPQYHPPLPLVISPHGRGVDPLANAGLFGDLPARGPFALIAPEGQGRELALYSWGWEGQINDLARMPRIVRETLPWLTLKPHALYAVGGSMGGQETLLLVARHPHLLTAAAAFDSVTDFARRYFQFPLIVGGRGLQVLARQEVPGTPATDPVGYRERSPLIYASAIAFSGIPLQIWWSVSDQIVVDQLHQSALLYNKIRKLNPNASVEPRIGFWQHSAEMTASSLLPVALERAGLLPATQH